MIPTTLVPSGIHHAQALGSVVVGPNFGEVPAVGANQLMRLLLPFKKEIYTMPGFQDQVYVIPKSMDGNITDIRLDAVQFETDPTTGAQILRLRADVAAVPASVDIWVEAHHSAGR